MESKKEKPLGFKVRHSLTGLYLSSVRKNKWTKIGKTWPRKGDITRAINQGLSALNRMKKFNGNKAEILLDDLSNWEVIELTESRKYSILYLIDKVKIT